VTLNELMLAQQIETMQRLQLAWIEFEGQPYVVDDSAPHGLRHSIAATLVRLGMMLDRSVGETPAASLQSSGNKEVRHAL
jgi:site-specific recombinase XerD